MINSDKYITSFLQGGLGNQMFQISQAYSQSVANDLNCFFEKKSYTPMQANQPDKYINNIFKKINFVDQHVKNLKLIYEDGFNYSKLNFNIDDSVMFHGYFQSSKNFLGFDEKIKNLFEPEPYFISHMSNKYPFLFNDTSTCSIHVRRGDYLTIPSVLPTINIDYFNFCVNKFSDDTIFVICSDDINWVEENFKDDKFIIIKDLEDYECLWLMSLCKNNIISNSSFSWWSAFLNKNKEKKVFVPSIWFGPSGPNPFDDIFEEEWERIPVEFINNELKLV